jgi:chemotaxis protein CheX
MDQPVAACAQIVGDWQLMVLLYCPLGLARHAAEVMLGVAKGGATTDDVQDVLCELINIISGNIKGVLSGSNRLSLPHIVNGSDFQLRFPRHVLLSEASFAYDGQPLVVRLLGEDRLATRSGKPSSASAGGAN